MRASDLATRWQKSSYSTNGGNCVEVAVDWRKSTYNSPNGGECVEIADNIPTAIPIRDSKDPAGPALLVTPEAWTSFLADVKNTRIGASR
ncbi:DUF397 domain-containing protein [Streptomyces sp. NPDC051162]|uniref:DUF397 domain-containing protein n=1 Tax=unclassified Streptomyces TaxID=2593676 RepID=UPI003447CA43